MKIKVLKTIQPTKKILTNEKYSACKHLTYKRFSAYEKHLINQKYPSL